VNDFIYIIAATFTVASLIAIYACIVSHRGGL
jgi:hypothetical protein